MSTDTATTAPNPRDFLNIDALLSDEELMLRDTVRATPDWQRAYALDARVFCMELAGTLRPSLMEEVLQAVDYQGVHSYSFAPVPKRLERRLTWRANRVGQAGRRTPRAVPPWEPSPPRAADRRARARSAWRSTGLPRGRRSEANSPATAGVRGVGCGTSAARRSPPARPSRSAPSRPSFWLQGAFPKWTGKGKSYSRILSGSSGTREFGSSDPIRRATPQPPMVSPPVFFR